MSIFALGCKQAVDVLIKTHPFTFRPAYKVGVTVPLKPVSGQWRVGSGAGSDYFCTKIRVKPRADSYLSFNWGVIRLCRRHFTVIKPQRDTQIEAWRGLTRIWPCFNVYSLLEKKLRSNTLCILTTMFRNPV
jgi:hypothetical protein